MPELKYDLIKVGRMPVHRSDDFRKFYQLKAARDIPEHGVKKGDLGGYVTHEYTLDQMGSCWIGEEAQVIGKHVDIVNDAYVGGKAVVRSDVYALMEHTKLIISVSAKVTGNATVFVKPSFAYKPEACHITDDAHIYGDAYVDTVKYVVGGSKIHGDAEINYADTIEHSEVYGRALIGKKVIIKQSSIYDDAMISEGSIVESSAIYGSAFISGRSHIAPGTVIEGNKTLFKSYLPVEKPILGEIFSVESLKTKVIETKAVSEPAKEVQVKAEVSAMIKAYREVCENIESYRNDVVKLIKYPVMTDQTNEHTLAMMSALKAVQRLEDTSDTAQFNDAVITLENAFMKAESNARKIASTLLSESDRKKTEKAKDLFRVASNEASSEHEKKNAFIQGFKQLEGVLDVPDVAVDAFRVKIGLPELEM